MTHRSSQMSPTNLEGLPIDYALQIIPFLHTSEVFLLKGVSSHMCEVVTRSLKSPRNVAYRGPEEDGSSHLWLQRLIDLGISIASIRMTHDSKHEALFQASKFGYSQVVELLLHKTDVDVNYGEPSLSQSTPLMIAVYQGNVDVVDLLLQHDGIFVGKRNAAGCTAMQIASVSGRRDIYGKLMSHFLNNTCQKDIEKDLTEFIVDTCLYGNIQ